MFGRPSLMSPMAIWWKAVARKIPIPMIVNAINWIFASSGPPLSSWKIPPVVAGVGLAGTPVFATLPVWTYPAVMPFAAAAVPVLKPSTVKMFTGISLSAM